jgi:hypothetical protein
VDLASNVTRDDLGVRGALCVRAQLDRLVLQRTDTFTRVDVSELTTLKCLNVNVFTPKCDHQPTPSFALSHTYTCTRIHTRAIIIRRGEPSSAFQTRMVESSPAPGVKTRIHRVNARKIVSSARALFAHTHQQAGLTQNLHAGGSSRRTSFHAVGTNALCMHSSHDLDLP